MIFACAAVECCLRYHVPVTDITDINECKQKRSFRTKYEETRFFILLN